MKDTQAIIERVTRISDTHQQLHLAVDPALMQMKAGQSVLARIGDGWTPYLRQQWFPVKLTKTALVVERPSDELYQPGQVVSLLGAVGQPFRFRRTLRSVLLVAYETDPTPLLLTIPALLGNHVGVTLVICGAAPRYSTAHLPPEVEVIVGDADLNWQNQVTTIGWADQVFCATAPELEALLLARALATFRARRAEVNQSYLFGVFRPPLPCGVGACGACLIKMKSGAPLLVCVDGPAFDLTAVHGMG